VSIDLLIRGVRRRSDAEAIDIAIDGGRIARIGVLGDLPAAATIDGEGSLVLPGLVNAHQHLDKTLLADELRPQRWGGMGALRAVNRAHRATYTEDDILVRASRVVEMALANGTTVIRAFTDVEPVIATLGVRALSRLRERYAGEVTIQVAAFPQETLYVGPDGERLMRQAMDDGADVVGGLPSGEATGARMRRHVDFCLELARARGADVHMLLDDSDDPAQRSLEYLALRTIECGWEGRVTAGHAGALSAYDHPHAEDVIARVRDAGISVCVNAHISLALQGRSDRGPIRRGTTRVAELLAAGVNVLAAQDDVDDPYYPLGRADQLEVAQYAAHVCHLAWPAELETVMDMVSVNAARALRLDAYGIEVGHPADLVVVGAPTVHETLRTLPPRRYVISGGRVLSEQTLTRVRHGGPATPPVG
jgi:cytosine deaminase